MIRPDPGEDWPGYLTYIQLGFERFRTIGWINEHYGPLSWDGRTDETGGQP